MPPSPSVPACRRWGMQGKWKECGSIDSVSTATMSVFNTRVLQEPCKWSSRSLSFLSFIGLFSNIYISFDKNARARQSRAIRASNDLLYEWQESFIGLFQRSLFRYINLFWQKRACTSQYRAIHASNDLLYAWQESFICVTASWHIWMSHVAYAWRIWASWHMWMHQVTDTNARNHS